MRILFILQFDSFVKTLIPVITQLRESNHSCEVVLYKKLFKINWITNEIISLLGDTEFSIGGKRKVYEEIKKEPDIVVLGTVGGRDITNFSEYIKLGGFSSKIATGYVGALLDNYPDKFVNGVKRRSYSDLIWVPGKKSKQKLISTNLIQHNSTIQVTGLPRFDELYELSKKWIKVEKSLILFIEQPTFPESKLERFQLTQNLCEIANIFSNHKLVIKPRFLSKTGHAHRPKHLLQDLLDSINPVPDNIEISENSLYDLFPKTYFAITISSTGGLEALLTGIPTYFINDYCKNENLYGTNYFKSLGCVTSIENIKSKQFPKSIIMK